MFKDKLLRGDFVAILTFKVEQHTQYTGPCLAS